MRTDGDFTALVQKISRYLRAHPLACDTPEGIERWWVPEDVPRPLGDIQCALDWLVAAGVAEKLVAADGRVRFRRGPATVESERLLQRLADGDKSVFH